MKIWHYVSLGIILLSIPSSVLAITAQEIVSRSEQIMRGETSHAVMDMTIERPEWTRTISIETWSEGTRKALITILAPPKEKGIRFLRIGNELWNYLPRIERTIKIPPSMMLQSWMGSDFTNDDLVKESHMEEDYYQQLLREETLNDNETYVIQLIPKPNAPVVWGKIITWIAKDNWVPLQQKFYDEEGELVNVMTMTDIRQLKDRYFPMKWVMEPSDGDGSTIIEVRTISFNEPIPESRFSLQELKR